MADTGEHLEPEQRDGIQHGEGDVQHGRSSASTGGNNTPAGWRTRDPVIAADKARREPQEQTVEPNHRPVGRFEHAQFVAFLSGRDFRFSANGDVILTIKVPYEYRDLVIPLSEAFGLPLSVDVEVWKPYQEARDE